MLKYFKIEKGFFLLYKTNRFPVDLHLFSNRSQKTSKCGKNISDTLGYDCMPLICSYHIFDVIFDLLLNRRMEHGIYLLNTLILHFTVKKYQLTTLTRLLLPGGGGYSTYLWVERCRAAPHTLTLFKINIADFPTLFKTELRFLISCLRHLSQILINKSL